MKDANIEGYFTNHSARHTGGTRLFHAGVDRKLVKEATGHSSDAVDKYQITSDEQREMMSRIIAGNQTHVSEVVAKEGSKRENCKDTTVTVSHDTLKTNVENDCKGVEAKNIGGMINDIIEEQTKSGKTTIKISIEITKE